MELEERLSIRMTHDTRAIYCSRLIEYRSLKLIRQKSISITFAYRAVGLVLPCDADLI
jgi:hypothetical protein